MYIVTTKMEIKRIRRLAREQGEDLQVQGLVCLPREIEKYVGSIARIKKASGQVVYRIDVRCNNFKEYASFETEGEAEQYLRDLNVREHLPRINKSKIN